MLGAGCCLSWIIAGCWLLVAGRMWSRGGSGGDGFVFIEEWLVPRPGSSSLLCNYFLLRLGAWTDCWEEKSYHTIPYKGKWEKEKKER